MNQLQDEVVRLRRDFSITGFQLTYKEIGQRLGISPSTVMHLYHHACLKEAERWQHKWNGRSLHWVKRELILIDLRAITRCLKALQIPYARD